jgi:hypothetical protein
MSKTALGLMAMTVSLVLGTVISLGSLIASGGQLDTEAMTGQLLSPQTVLVTCLDPLAIGLEVAAIVLIVRGRHHFGASHPRLAVWAAILYVAWAAANLLGFLPLSIVGMMQGSRPLLLAGQWVKAASAGLAFTVPVLLVFGLSPKPQRLLLGLALLLSIVGGLGNLALTIGQLEIQPITTGGHTLYAPKWDVDYTAGVYPALVAASHVGGFLYLAAYVWLGWRIRSRRARATAEKEGAA